MPETGKAGFKPACVSMHLPVCQRTQTGYFGSGHAGLVSTNYRNVVLVMHQFDAAIKVVIFENSLPLRGTDFTETGDPPEGWGVRVKRGQSVWQGLDRSTSAPLLSCTCLQQAGLRQTRRLQGLGRKKASYPITTFAVIPLIIELIRKNLSSNLRNPV